MDTSPPAYKGPQPFRIPDCSDEYAERRAETFTSILDFHSLHNGEPPPEVLNLFKSYPDIVDGVVYLMLGVAYRNSNPTLSSTLIKKGLPHIQPPYDAYAHLVLGNMYYFGCETEKNDDKAKEHFQQASDMGLIEALHRLGSVYHLKKNDEADKLAYECYIKAAGRGHVRSQHCVGLSYWYGKGVPQDLKKATEYFFLAAEQDYAYSQCHLGEMYLKGTGWNKERDCTKGINLLILAANQGFDKAQDKLAQHLWSDSLSQADQQTLFQYYQRVVPKGNARDEWCLGMIYVGGRGTAVDFPNAFKYFKSSAEKGHKEASWSLGSCYLNGWGSPVDKAMACFHFQRAAVLGFAPAQQDLDENFSTPDPKYQKV